MDVKSAGYMGLEGQDLIEALEVISFIDEVMTDSEMDGKDRHHKFRSD